MLKLYSSEFPRELAVTLFTSLREGGGPRKWWKESARLHLFRLFYLYKVDKIQEFVQISVANRKCERWLRGFHLLLVEIAAFL